MKTANKTNSARPGKPAMPKQIRRLRIVGRLALAAVFACWASPAQATVIPVPNFSFENPDTGAFSTNIDNWLTAGPPQTFTAVIENGTQGTAIAGITGSQFGNIDGNRAGARLYQDLIATYTVGESYTLTVDVATRQNSLVSAGAILRLQLSDSSDAPLAYTDVPGSTVLAAGANITTFTVNLPVLSTDAWAGQPIRIKLEGTVETGQGADWVVDNVRLESQPIALGVTVTSPTPASTIYAGAPVSASATVVEADGTAPFTVEYQTRLLPEGSFASHGSSDTNAPYTVELGSFAAGDYEIKAIVTDSTPSTPKTAESVTTFTVLATVPVSFNSNGGSVVESQAVTYNTTATQPTAPILAGYSFAGWYADAGLANLFSFSTPITAATTLYAKWTLDLQSSTTTSGADTIITFTAGGGTWTPPTGVTSVELLVVGGGGGGGGGTAHQYGGGGGAGGLVYQASVAVAGSLSVTVGGAGRSGQQVDGVNGGLPHVAENGGDSSFGTLVALGGGGGSNSQNGGISARDGGSGGGGYNNAPAGAALQPGSTSGGYGNNGAVGTGGPGGGGGGAGTAGGGTDGKGGDGLSYAISGAATYYAGGGAGAGGTAGLGGGGAPNTAGTANTGGGGGGAQGTDGPGAGGSGVVIIRYTAASGSPYDTWANGTFSPALTQKLPGDDQDGDGHINLLEYAFGTEPTVSFSGGIIYVSGGTVSTHGQPVIFPQGNDYFTVFGRRTDHATAGLTYTVQFTAGLDVWVDNDDLANPPEQVATDGTIDAIRVKYPESIVTPSGSQKPTFSRVMVVGN